MFDMLSNILFCSGLPKEESDRCAAELLGVVVLTIIGSSETLLSPSEEEVLRNHIAQGRFTEVLPLIEGKYSDCQWEQMLERNVAPLLDSYFMDVLHVLP